MFLIGKKKFFEAKYKKKPKNNGPIRNIHIEDWKFRINEIIP